MTPRSHPVRCRCGKFRGALSHPERGTRAVCYCRDCQAYGHFLGPGAGVLDRLGGTEVVAVRPRDLRFVEGVEHLACMSLTPNGTLRWFTHCCRTAIGNTPRDIRLAHLGLVHTALVTDAHDLAESFGPIRMHVNRRSAHGEAAATSAPAFAAALVPYVARLAWSRLSGEFRDNPFFDAASGLPRVAPEVLSKDELQKLRRVVAAGSAQP